MHEMEIDNGNRRERVPITYPPNSKASKAAERPPVKPVVTSEVRERPRGIFGKVVKDFVQEDRHTLMEYIVLEVAIPAAKNLFLDMVTKGGERLLYGISRPSGRTGRAVGFYTNYGGSPQSTKPADPRPTISRQARTVHDFRDVVIQTRVEAEDVIEGLRELIDLYGSASVADLYSLLDMTGEFTDQRWGWEDLRRASVRTIRGGFVLDLPDTVPLA
jgi:hypothetical protein